MYTCKYNIQQYTLCSHFKKMNRPTKFVKSYHPAVTYLSYTLNHNERNLIFQICSKFSNFWNLAKPVMEQCSAKESIVAAKF